jgi:hypothetical protein
VANIRVSPRERKTSWDLSFLFFFLVAKISWDLSFLSSVLPLEKPGPNSPNGEVPDGQAVRFQKPSGPAIFILYGEKKNAEGRFSTHTHMQKVVFQHTHTHTHTKEPSARMQKVVFQHTHTHTHTHTPTHILMRSLLQGFK